MGACQCVERVTEEKQLVTAKNKTKFKFNNHELIEDGFGETKDHFLVTAKSGLHKSTTQQGEKEDILEAELSFSVLAESKHEDQVQNHETPSGVLNISGLPELKTNKLENEIEKQIVGDNKSMLSEISGKLNYRTQDSIFVPFRLSEDQEMDYADFNHDLFKLFNEIRLSPEKYELTADSRLKSTLRKISVDRVDTILWSQKNYDVAFEYLNALPDRKIATTLIHEYLQKEINSEIRAQEEHYKLLTISHYGKHDESTLLSLLTENIADAKVAFTENYAFGFICSIPVGKDQDRTLLCIAKKNLI